MARVKYYDTSLQQWVYADEMMTYPVATTTSDGLMSSSDKVALNGKEDTSNKTTSISSSSTDTQYPSAKAVYSSLSTKLSDAPSDNKQYARKNGAWSEVEKGGGGDTPYYVFLDKQRVTEDRYTVYTSNKTYNEVKTAIENGERVIFIVSDLFYGYLMTESCCGMNGITMTFTDDYSTGVYQIRFNATNILGYWAVVNPMKKDQSDGLYSSVELRDYIPYIELDKGIYGHDKTWSKAGLITAANNYGLQLAFSTQGNTLTASQTDLGLPIDEVMPWVIRLYKNLVVNIDDVEYTVFSTRFSPTADSLVECLIDIYCYFDDNDYEGKIDASKSSIQFVSKHCTNGTATTQIIGGITVNFATFVNEYPVVFYSNYR